jgi:UDP-2-acetamido-2,6-beta-L-arabino-hexul-4-ose reductase
MNITITGADGFIAKNLIASLEQQAQHQLFFYKRGDDDKALQNCISKSDVIFHLAGENRPKKISAFETANVDLTELICLEVSKTNRNIPIIFSSSTQAIQDNPYGVSKLSAEKILEVFAQNFSNTVIIFRLCGVFGKWCKPNYNSVVSTFCHNIVNNIPLEVSNPAQELDLIYIDDVVNMFNSTLEKIASYRSYNLQNIPEFFTVSLQYIINSIELFKESRNSLIIPEVGTGFLRALYATYLSHLNPKQFSYPLEEKKDERGSFIEILKTQSSGQFSFFTAHPGVTRGGHFHHTKNEKFLILQGQARFHFKNINTHETYTLTIAAESKEVIETIPGWSHDITNIGNDEMLVLLWANEIFDPQIPDTYSYNLYDE